jgi:hypothetical protein
MYGLFEVLSVGHNELYCKLKLPISCKIHPTSNISLLERYRGMDPEREVVEIEADDKRWMMEMIMASRPSTEDATKHVYLAKWNFFSTNDNPWESFQNVNDNARGSMEDYYKNNPNTDNDKRYGARVLERKSRKRKQKNCIICLCLIYV